MPLPSARQCSEGVRKLAKKVVYPSKTTLNLCIKEKSQFNAARLIPLLLIVLILAAVFCKFGVIDRMQRTSKLQAETAALRSQRDALNAELANYDDIAAQYSRYSIGWMTEDEKTLVKRSDMLDLVESMLMPGHEVRDVTVNNNMLSATIAGVTLQDTSKLVEALYAREDVSNVVVYTASNGTTKDGETGVPAVSMIITMQAVEEGGEAK